MPMENGMEKVLNIMKTGRKNLKKTILTGKSKENALDIIRMGVYHLIATMRMEKSTEKVLNMMKMGILKNGLKITKVIMKNNNHISNKQKKK